MIGDAGFPANLVIGAAEASRVGKLESNEEVVGGAEVFGMSIRECGEKLAESILISGSGQSLVRVGPPVGLNGSGFASPDELGPTQAKVAPAAESEFGGGTVRICIPTFHGVNAPAVADLYAANLYGLCKWGGLLSGEHGLVKGQVEL